MVARLGAVVADVIGLDIALVDRPDLVYERNQCVHTFALGMAVGDVAFDAIVILFDVL